MKKYWISILTGVLGICTAGQAGLIAHYTFDDSTNMTADASGNGNPLSVYPGYGTPGYSAAGKSGGAATFDGSTQGWMVTNNIYPAGGSFSFAAWVQPQGPFNMISSPLTSDGFQVYAAGAYRFLTYGASGAISFVVGSEAPVTGDWQHIAMTYEALSGPVDGVYTGTIKGYLNGVLIATKTGALYEETAIHNAMMIGRHGGAVFNGLMDEVRVYDNALPQSDIQALVSSSAQGTTIPAQGTTILGQGTTIPAQGTTILAHYTFDDAKGLGRDNSGNGHDLVAFDIAPDYSNAGKIDGAAAFDGATQGYRMPGPVFPAGSFSFSLWIKPNSLNQMVVSANSLSSGIGITVGPSEFRFFTRHAGGYSWVSGYIIPDLEQWQHLTMTFEADAEPDKSTGSYTGVLKAYHNGILTSVMTDAQYVADSGNPLNIGHRAAGFFDGAIDDVRVYDAALTPDEVKALMPDPADIRLGSHAGVIPASQPEATVPWWIPRHQAVLERIREGNVDLLMIGDSIMHFWESRGKAVWEKYYANRNAVNLGFGGDRTQLVLWRMQNGEIDGINPKLAVLLIGTNNTGIPNQSPELIADGIAAIVRELRSRLPNTKILLLGIFPRGSVEQSVARLPEAVYNWQWEKIDQVNQLISGMADNQMIYYLNINDKFLNADGALPNQIAPDLLHPSEAGYEIWAAAMEPTIRQLMNEK